MLERRVLEGMLLRLQAYDLDDVELALIERKLESRWVHQHPDLVARIACALIGQVRSCRAR